ncbi:3-oxoacyl-[acyl-carrier-protein] synthase III [Austwickia chelonae]|uniref:Beta-ketoacyl-[acyl-carrier-protein] synthase III n=1 Tax=Austwickia chelonae NBRC 105200 TaxID=1184607 RepID=K6ULI8_9MICO|nr:beta-ketoacyl-ACP synthase III [Austwickia chelonae]GAB77286.1 3-oxoacyl-[acyl-carrier-protein] synthase III [Austwickia chelonae NBRC 105200]SEW06994.1 3-oxoacyl-[acyl-carrier-protein] synthase III [Austwickia chelonae]
MRTVRTVRGPEFTRILGIGDYRPGRVVGNVELCEHIDSSDEWIRSRSGIRQRRQAEPHESVVDMGVAAAQAALDQAGLPGEKVDAVICATITHPWQTPAAAPLIAHRLGAGAAGAYDLSAACAGYCYGIANADDLIRAGRARHVVVVGVEKLSDYRNLSDRGTAFVFGDGAGAAVVGPSDTPGISVTTWGSDGSGHQLITQSASWSEMQRRYAPESTGLVTEPEELSDAESSDVSRWPFIDMQGPSVFRWAVSRMGPVCEQALANAGVRVDDLDVFIPHQANSRIIEAMARRLDLPQRVVVADDITDMANTSAASVPLATAALLRDRRAKSGDLALQIGFGAGLSWAAQVVVLP